MSKAICKLIFNIIYNIVVFINIWINSLFFAKIYEESTLKAAISVHKYKGEQLLHSSDLH